MQLECPVCKSPLTADEVNIDRAIAECNSCNVAFTVEGVRSEARAPKPEVSLPENMRIETLGNELTLTRRWFGPAAIFLALFSATWDGFLIFMAVAAVRSGAGLPMLAFGSIHALVGVGLTYFTLCLFVNSTTIRVRKELTVEHGPLPFPGHVRLPRESIEQLFAKRRLSRGRNSSSQHYEVHALLRSGAGRKLVSGLESEEHALFIEQELERHLRIEDEPVRGEIGDAA